MTKYSIDNYAVTVPGVISKARENYRRNHIPMSQLLSDYAAVYLPHYLATTAINPWAQRQTQERLPYERGVSVAETMFLSEAVNLKRCLPTDVIKALFYSQSNNDSAVECCVLRKIFRQYSRKGRQSAVINPCPDFLIEDYDETDNTVYVVMDDLIARLYRQQFRTDRIVSINESADLPSIDTFAVMQRQYPDLEKLLSVLPSHSPNATILALLPSTVIDEQDGNFWTELQGNGMYVRSAIRIDSKLLSTPRKKTLFVISDSAQNDVTLWDSVYDSESSELIIDGPVREIDYDRFRYGSSSIIKLLKTKTEAEGSSPKTRRPAKHYDFSDEIRLLYTVKSDKSGSPKITASYHSILRHGETRTEGKRISENYIRRTGTLSEDSVLLSIVLEDSLRPLIAADVKDAYADSSLTLKTCWYLCIDRLKSDREYNDDIAREWFSSNNPLAKIRISESTPDDILKAAEAALGRDRDSIEYTYWRQLDIIIKKARQAGLASSNPVEDYIQSRSNAYTKRQSEVRDALTKKTLEPEEMQRIMDWICADTSDGKRYSSSVEAAAAVLKILGISNSEICALTWGDYRSTEYIGRQLRITKYLGADGKVHSYDLNMLRRIRFIPLPVEIEYMLDAYYSNIKTACCLDDSEMMSRPILSETAGQESFLPLRRMRTITRHILQVAQIDPLMIVLHDGDQVTHTDLHMYRGDFFRENADFYFGHICRMKEGEICYLLGSSAPTTLDEHYLDYGYELMQYRMMTEMRRWLCRYDRLIGIPTEGETKIGIAPLCREMRIVSDDNHSATAQILFPDGCPENTRISVRSGNGIRWNCTVVKGERQ